MHKVVQPGSLTSGTSHSNANSTVLNQQDRVDASVQLRVVGDLSGEKRSGLVERNEGRRRRSEPEPREGEGRVSKSLARAAPK